MRLATFLMPSSPEIVGRVSGPVSSKPLELATRVSPAISWG